jgi:hypothetical protein
MAHVGVFARMRESIHNLRDQKRIPIGWLTLFWGEAAVTVLVSHTLLLYLAIGPYNLFIDSPGYLYTAKQLFESGQFIFDPRRPIGLPLLFFLLLSLGRCQLAFIVGFQIICFLGAIFHAIRLLFPGRSWAFHSWLTVLIVLLSLRTFVYSYMILSEGLFSCELIIFTALFINYARSNAARAKQNQLHWLLCCALAAAWTKSIGGLLVGVAIVLYAHHFWFSRRKISVFIVPALILGFALTANKLALDGWGFSRQEGMQFLVSANRYINYDTAYMAREKSLIRDSHQEILKRFAPRTRLDQMLGPVEGVLAPAEILLREYPNYEDFNRVVSNLVLEGLLVDNDIFRFAWSGLIELYKMIVGDIHEGLIIPLEVQDYNQIILERLAFLQNHNGGGRFIGADFARKYYFMQVRAFVLPKYFSVAFLVCAILVAWSLIGDRKTAIILPAIGIAGICFICLYLSCLLVFALDRYFVGVESVLWLVSFYLVSEIIRCFSNKVFATKG